ncbi:uncharacterized protein V6R79_011620 [Siganus canaliculatus]
MNSLGSSSKWSSYDSLPYPTSSFLLSESEQTEDEADVFSEGEGDTGITKTLSVREGDTHSGNFLKFPTHSGSRSRSNQPDHPCDEMKHPGSASSPGAPTLGSSNTSMTPGDLVFAQKCTDLRRFIPSLLGLLHGLKTGRFDKGLSSFQQSVAIDRLQRILGVLQKPEMGEKYLHNLLQIEIMLKMWFPRVAFQSADTSYESTTPTLPQHWRQNQLCMPVKKRKLSWSVPEQAGKLPAKHKQHQHGKHWRRQAAASLDTISTCVTGSVKHLKTRAEEEATPTLGSCAAKRQFPDSNGILSRPSHSFSQRENGNREQPGSSLLTPCGSPAAQDCSVSSSDSVTKTDSP